MSVAELDDIVRWYGGKVFNVYWGTFGGLVLIRCFGIRF